MGREFEIRKEVVLDATPEQVWHAIATEEGQSAWLFPSELPADAEVEPGKRIAVRTPEGEDGSFQAFEYLVEARDGGSTVLRFVHSGFLGDDWGDEFVDLTQRGWDLYFHTLHQYLTYFADRPATFVEAEAPESSAQAGAWERLEKALGITGPIADGDPVRLTPAGLPPLEGVVDYYRAGDDFLGLRTADGLYRFHGRARIGMPIAAGHHLYGEHVDRDAIARAWQDWLNGVFG